MPSDLRRLADRQDAVLSARQILDAGMSRSRVQRLVEEGAWQRQHPGVYVVHSGPVEWRSRAHAALLHAGDGAALSHHSAAYVHELVLRPPASVEVVVPHQRRVVGSSELRIRRRRAIVAERRARLVVVDRAETVLDLLGAAPSEDRAAAVLCEALRRRVPPDHLLDALGRRARLRHRSLALDVLGTPTVEVESPLELRYRRDVERRHGLPRAVRQRWELLDGRWLRADAVYEGLGVRVELDGEVAHPGGRTDADVWRDNAVAVGGGGITLRYRWPHVVADPCGVARQVAEALAGRGWTRSPRLCGLACTATR
ncbi:hypothetical protein GCM10010972_14490 [Cellulomonas carbonis]|uniref:AbiEi antitoxin N-terminal domain-containing protein n=2 Tax=Cellulomonas carbonis TaxID=1386092 RepID=A0A0A0BU76_9CELL|nr:hypothetical protein N868_17220 [Cellulomonas carbonis T26]GGC02628.1 hypothetical protein GCM10010972_14490 [Cellulomonas carbonis]